jgi:hypothetical protein
MKPHKFEDVKRLEAIAFRAKQLKDEVAVDASGTPRPSLQILRSAAEHLAYEDVDWLLNRVEENWE